MRTRDTDRRVSAMLRSRDVLAWRAAADLLEEAERKAATMRAALEKVTQHLSLSSAVYTARKALEDTADGRA